MDTIERFKEQARRIIETFQQEVKGVRANRASAALVEDIKVDYYGTPTSMSHIGSIHIVPPREIQIQVWDKDAVQSVVQAIESSDLGLSASVEDQVIKIYLPELSKERREELIKHIKKVVERFKIQVRTGRDEYNKEIEKLFEKKEIGEDDKFRLKEELQEVTEETNKSIDEVLKHKEEEINQ